MASAVTSGVLPFSLMNFEIKSRFRVRVESLDSADDSTVLSSDGIVANRVSSIRQKQKDWALFDSGKWGLKSRIKNKECVPKDLQVLWDDGYSTKTAKDCFEGSKEMIRPDGGPPRWFSPVECGQPIKDSPVLLSLPGIDCVGLNLTLHHRALGKVFEVWCLHVPLHDLTPFEGLLKIVEETVKCEHAFSANKPIYLVGDSFGGCLALAVAARNPEIDLVVILSNPATSFGRSQLQPLVPLAEPLPDGLHNILAYPLSFSLANPVLMAMADIDSRLPTRIQIEKFFHNAMALLQSLSGFSDVVTKETFLWRLKLLKSASAYANSRLHAVKAEVLLLAGGKDNVLPSGDEARRLKSSLQNCTVRYFKDNGHTLLLEDGLSLLTVIKGTGKYRSSRRHDFVSDFLPPSISEFKRIQDRLGLLYAATAPALAIFSTLDNGKIVRGLAGVPSDGPVLLVGYHTVLAAGAYLVVQEFLRAKKIMIRSLAHAELFSGKTENSDTEFSSEDWLRIMGGLPATPSNLSKLLSTKSHVLLSLGGSRETSRNKGDEYKLMWLDETEFVRMAAQYGATIVPFGSVGDDDIADVSLDIPIVSDYIRELNRNQITVRGNSSTGNAYNIPVISPKVPGRIYYLFGKPIRTKGQEEMLKDRGNAKQLFMEIKSEVEQNRAYLLKKREKDPYRNIIDRIIYRALYSHDESQVPAFDP